VARSEHIVTLPNLLTVVRVPMAALLWASLGDRTWLTAMLAAAALTDILDGRVARAIRKRRLERGADPDAIGESYAVGAWLDPLCDKLFVLSAIFYIWIGWSVPLGLIVLVGLRELIVLPITLVYLLFRDLHTKLRFDFRASAVGKAATVSQFAAALSFVYLPTASLYLAVVAAVIGCIAAASYLRRAVVTARYMATNELVFARWLEIQDRLHGKSASAPGLAGQSVARSPR